MDINLVPKFIDEAATPPARSVGNTLSNLWELGVGNHIKLWVQKQEIKQQQNIENFKKKLEEKTQSIPEEDLVEPKINIVGPAIEASKYHIDSSEIREMFANLIAASIDRKKVDRTHPSFVEIVKQLSPLDAQNIKLFDGHYQIPICEYRLINKSREYQTRYTNVFLKNKLVNNLNLIASSLENLARLGLIIITYDNFMTAEGIYDQFKNTKEYKALQNLLSTGQYPNYTEIEIRGGLTKTTPLGKDFIKICLN